MVLLPLILALAALSVRRARAVLQFSYTAPTSCDPLTVHFSGGNPPYWLQITTAFQDLQNISIPTTSANNGAGSYTLDHLLLGPGNQTVLTMSDTTGFASGGTSAMLTVGSSLTNFSCNTAPSHPAFVFSAPDSFTQCNQFSFSVNTGATPPVTVTGLIPLGETFSVTSAVLDFTIPVNTRAGTQVIFFMRDATGRSGGATDFLTTLTSIDNSCLNASSPSSTQDSGTAPTQAGSGQHSANSAVIAAAVIGGIAAFTIIGAFVWFVLFRDRQKHEQTVVMADPYNMPSGAGAGGEAPANPRWRMSRRVTPVDLLAAHRQGYTLAGLERERSPTASDARSRFGDDASGAGGTGGAHEGHLTSDDPSLTPHPFTEPPTPTSFTSSARTGPPPSKAALAARERDRARARSGSWGPARFILHTDAGAVDEAPEDENVVELPPTYTDVHSTASRSPQPGLNSPRFHRELEPPSPGFAPSARSSQAYPSQIYNESHGYPPAHDPYPAYSDSASHRS